MFEKHRAEIANANGQSKITKTWVDINGAIFDWRKPRSLPQIYKDYIYIGDEKMLLLNFTSNGWIYVKGGKEPFEKKWLVPLPPGKELEAGFVITEITKNFLKKVTGRKIRYENEGKIQCVFTAFSDFQFLCRFG